MKIEKINEHQIRCFLTQEDLDSRNINLSELAYGSEKAKELFHEMMQQANDDFGFEVGDMPLMIEAIPLSSGRIVLNVTKVDSPEELDTRFSNFTRFDDPEESKPAHSVPDLLNLFEKLKEDAAAAISEASREAAPKQAENKTEDAKAPVQKAKSEDLTRLFSCESMDTYIHVAHMLKGIYNAANSLYKNPADNRYYLIMTQGKHDKLDFARIVNVASSYLQDEPYSPVVGAHVREHFNTVIAKHALSILADL